MSSSGVAARADVADSTPDRVAPVRRRRRGRTALTFWMFTGPFVIGMLIFVYIPIVWSFVLSFFEAQNTVTPTKFIGLENYKLILRYPDFRHSLVTFTIFAAFVVPLTFVLALGLALIVHRLRFARAFFRSVFFIPTACSYVVASLIWRMSIFNGVRFGLANTILSHFGVDNISWLITINPPWYWLPLVTVRLWLQLGFYMILFLAGLQAIPKELYEAAEVDGATPGWKTFRHITLPQLRATSVAVLLLCIVAAYQAFDEFYNVMPLSTADVARPPLYVLYQVALGSQQDYGRGSAGAMILAAIIMVVTLLQGKLFGFGKQGD